MIITERIERIIEPSLTDLGYELVRVILSGAHRPILQIMAERADRKPMTVDDCALISRTLSALLDVEDPMEGTYTLEVSSPGIDRPLTRLKDFDRFAGYEARIEMRWPIDGRKRFRGTLLGVEDDRVRVRLEEGEATLPYADISKAKLVLTEALIAASTGASAGAAAG